MAEEFTGPHIRRNYPGLQPQEAVIWTRWLAQNPTRFDRYDYNVRVGAGRDPGESYPLNLRHLGILLSQARIDVVGWNGGLPTIIEIEVSPDVSTIGQVVQYDALWRRERPGQPEPKLLVICADCNADQFFALTRAGAIVERFPVPRELLFPPRQT